ncbi:TRL-like family protein [Psychroflexus maritimus]|uniref:TRL-like family protein n=1 Tax=Psychroflexus maritimus TaxID=2714865 RepID=A0A967ADW1_9FLAO|nr:TRL-like family protein [Psychroflexus maritimus]NGZ90467.1 hypothetical protein [Psychroflexus maritimus]
MKKIFILGVMALAMVSCTVTMPVNATSNEVGSKTGTASTTSILGLHLDGGDASIRTAAKKGGIKKISTVDFKTTNYLFLIGQYETIVTGN